MTSTSDRILDLIDAGLQSSSESDRYRDVAPSVGEGCVRCDTSDVPEGGDLCKGCRAFLLDDSETDPAATGNWGGQRSTLTIIDEVQENLLALYGPRVREFTDLDRRDITARVAEWAVGDEATPERVPMRWDQGWDVRGGEVGTLECQVCGSPVAELADREPQHDEYTDLLANPFATRTMKLSPCGHTDLDATHAGLAWGTRHDYDRLGAVMWWAHLWANYWEGPDGPAPAPTYPPRLAGVLAETGMVTLLDTNGRPMDRVASNPAPGGDDRLLRPTPLDLTVGDYRPDAHPGDVVITPTEEYRREPGGIYRRFR